MPKTILLLRHGEEPAVQPDLDLSNAGRRRADRLAHYIPAEFGEPDEIFVAAPSTSSVRCYLTVRPLATAVKVVINGSYKGEDYAPLAYRLLGDPAFEEKCIVVCWTHKELPSLAAFLNVSRDDFPVRWPDEVYDALFVLSYKRNARPRVKAIKQPF